MPAKRLTAVVRRTGRRNSRALRLAGAFAVLLLSLLLGPRYVLGDQLYYRHVYDAMPSLGLEAAYDFYYRNLSSTEVVHFLSVWVGSRLLPKDIFMALANGALAYAILTLLERWRAHPGVAFALVLTNYYCWVLYFAAERLKFGVLFLALSFAVIADRKRFSAYSALAVLSHMQTLALYASAAVVRFGQSVTRVRLSSWTVVPLVFLLIPIGFLSEHLMRKATSHSGDYGVLELLKLVLFMGVTLIYARRKTDAALAFAPLLVAAALVGASRLNIFGYFVFLAYGLRVNRGVNVGVLATTIYFAARAIGFGMDIWFLGTGF